MFISTPLQFIRESHDMGSCLSRTTLTRRERQLQARSSCQLDSISVSTVNKKGDSTHQILLTIEEDRSTHLSELSIDSGTNICHSNVQLDNEGYKAMLACHDKVVAALAMDYLTIAGALLTREFVSEEVFSKMLLPSSTPYEKGAILVTAAREGIKIAPQRFLELVKIFSEHTSTKSVVNLLQSAYQGESETLICMLIMHVCMLCNNYLIQYSKSKKYKCRR